MRGDGEAVLLAEYQNTDGGWPYQRADPSWTEPTAYAILALASRPCFSGAARRGLEWLIHRQRADGGWAPHPAVRQSTWVTAVAALAGPALIGEQAYRRAVAWVLAQSGADTSPLIRVRQFLTANAQTEPGWPWYPATSAWVTPTSLSMLLLRQSLRHKNDPAVRARLEAGAGSLLGRVCQGGGWNHGSPQALGYDAGAYPETTGVALLALAGQSNQAVADACRWARRALGGCRTSEGESWLRMGLLAQNQLPPDAPPPARPQRNVQHIALACLAGSAAAGHNRLLEG